MAKITIEKDYEVRHWMRTLTCSELQLRQAVKAVGPEEEAVRRYLQKEVPLSSRWNMLARHSRRGRSSGFGGP